MRLLGSLSPLWSKEVTRLWNTALIQSNKSFPVKSSQNSVNANLHHHLPAVQLLVVQICTEKDSLFIWKDFLTEKEAGFPCVTVYLWQSMELSRRSQVKAQPAHCIPSAPLSSSEVKHSKEKPGLRCWTSHNILIICRTVMKGKHADHDGNLVVLSVVLWEGINLHLLRTWTWSGLLAGLQ